MPDLGERGNVMGPQPIAPIVQPPAEMLAAAEHLLNALIRGDHASVEAMTPPHVRDEMMLVAKEIPPNKYDRFELIGRARVAKHYFLKAQLIGRQCRTVQVSVSARRDRRQVDRSRSVEPDRSPISMEQVATWSDQNSKRGT